MKILLLAVVAAAAVIHETYASLIIKGPGDPVLEGEPVQLECFSSESEFNISQVHFQVFSKYMRGWRSLYDWTLYDRSWCYYSSREGQVQQVEDRLVLTIPHAGRYSEGPYRCVADGNNDEDNLKTVGNTSEALTFKVHYMGELYLTREGFSRYLGLPQDLTVRVGDDVVVKCSSSSSEEPSYFWKKEGVDWILPKSMLTLTKVSVQDSGLYTCMAEHPTVASLNKKRTFSLIVLPEDAPWYQTSYGHLVLTVSAAAAVLLVLVVSMTVFLCRRTTQIKTSKGPIDDKSQKKPIYRNSVESLPSTCGDQQPLV